MRGKKTRSPAGSKASSLGTPTKGTPAKGKGTPAKEKGTPAKGKGTPDSSQKTIDALFKKQLTPKRKKEDGEEHGTDSPSKKQALSLEVDREGRQVEWKDVTSLHIDANMDMVASNEKDADENDARYLRDCQKILKNKPSELPPQSECEKIMELLLRERGDSPGSPEITMMAFQNLQLVHALHPPVELAYKDDASGASSPYLLRNPQAWTPIDSKRFLSALQEAKNMASREDRARKAGQLLLLRLLVDALEHDLAHRAAVFAAHRSPDLLTGSALWRTLDALSFDVKTKVMEPLFHLIAGDEDEDEEEEEEEAEPSNVPAAGELGGSPAALSSLAQRLLALILELHSLLEEEGASDARALRGGDSSAAAAFRCAADLFRTDLSLPKQMACLRGMVSPRHKLRLIRSAVGHHASERSHRELNKGGYGGSHGVLDILRYLAGSVSEAVSKEKANGGVEDAVNRVGMYLAHAALAIVDARLQDPGASPSPMNAAEVAKQLPAVREELQAYVKTRKGLCINPEVQAALAMAELALQNYE